MMTIAATALHTRWHAAPTLPAAFAGLDTIDRGAQYRMIAGRLDTVRKAYGKHTRWLEACAVYSAGGEGAEAPSLRLMPGKDAKHRMYGAAGDLARACGWPADTSRCHNLDDIAVLIATVESLLRGGE